jgi:hypothetical protein
VNGLHSLGCAGCGEERWRVGTVVGVEPGFWVVECGVWIARRVRSLCGLIASAQGWPPIERK